MSILRVAFLFLFFSSEFLFCQNIEIIVDGSNSKKAFIYELVGEISSLKDSVFTSEPGIFNFSLKNNIHQGFYRFIFENNKGIDFLNDGSDIILHSNTKSVIDSLVVYKSESNITYQKFIKINKQYKTKSELLQLILYRYPKDDDYYLATRIKLEKLQTEYSEFVNQNTLDKQAFISRYIKSAQLLKIKMATSPERDIEYLKTNSLENIDFNDVELVYSDLFVNKTIEYLSYYSNQQLTKEMLEKEFIKAIELLLKKAKTSQIVYQHIVDYLITGFKKFGFEKLIDYIVSNYLVKDDLCLGDKTESLIQLRIEQSKKIKIGLVAPNIISRDLLGNAVNLSEIKSDRILIVFYASWCPHCKEILPKLNELYSKAGNNKFEIVAISLDTKKEDWLNFVKTNSLKFLNVCDLKGWDSKAGSDYYIYATPTMILLDKDKIIIGKPASTEEVNNLLIRD